VERGYRDIREWVDRLIARDSDAWRDFLVQIGPMVKGICKRSDLDADETEDIAQALVLKLLERNCRILRGLEITTAERFFGWIKVIISHLVIDRVRLGKARRNYEEKWARERYRDVLSGSMDDATEARVFLEIAEKSIGLSDRILLHLDLAGLQDKEIACILGVELNALQKRQSRMRDRLRKIARGEMEAEKT